MATGTVGVPTRNQNILDFIGFFGIFHWRIQGFPDGGGRMEWGELPEFGGENQLFDKIFVENCKKMKVNLDLSRLPPFPPMHLTRFRLSVH